MLNRYMLIYSFHYIFIFLASDKIIFNIKYVQFTVSSRFFVVLLP